MRKTIFIIAFLFLNGLSTICGQEELDEDCLPIISTDVSYPYNHDRPNWMPPDPSASEPKCDLIWWKYPRGTVFNTENPDYYDPAYGYPERGVNFVGLNDTLTYCLNFHNLSPAPYSLIGKEPEKWYEPKSLLSPIDSSWRNQEKKSIQYRTRRWRETWYNLCQPRDTLPAYTESGTQIVFDIWNLPLGSHYICVDTTQHFPKDVERYPARIEYEYQFARDLADSTNAYEANFWRLNHENNIHEAKKWVDSILVINPNSVPGNWLLAFYYHRREADSTKALVAYRKAFDCLLKGSDRAMPDSTKKKLTCKEKNYLNWCLINLKYFAEGGK